MVDAVRRQANTLMHASKEFLASARDATMPTIHQAAYFEAPAQNVILRGEAQLKAEIEVPVYLDGREFARASARYMGERMDWEMM